MTGEEILAAQVRARMGELDLKQKDVRQLTGISPTTLSKILRADPSVTTTTLNRLDPALQWDVGTARSWREGRGGVTIPAVPTQSELEQMAEALAPLVAERLRGGSRADTLALKLADLPAPLAVALEALIDQVLITLAPPGGSPSVAEST